MPEDENNPSFPEYLKYKKLVQKRNENMAAGVNLQLQDELKKTEGGGIDPRELDLDITTDGILKPSVVKAGIKVRIEGLRTAAGLNGKVAFVDSWNEMT